MPTVWPGRHEGNAAGDLRKVLGLNEQTKEDTER